MEKGVEPNAALEAMDWTEIAPLMDVQYRMYNPKKDAEKPDKPQPKPLPPGYKKIYNNKGQLVVAMESDWFKDRPEYWEQV